MWTEAFPLPEDFRPTTVLAFHGRDVQQVAERLDGQTLQKGLLWQSQPARLSITFAGRQAIAELQMDGDCEPAAPTQWRSMVRRMLGLDQPIAEFERCHGQHPHLGPLINRQRGLRVPVTTTPFEAVTWAITGQQISLSAAISIRRKLIVHIGRRHSSGLYCFPDATALADLDAATLRSAGYSRAKADTLLTISRLTAQNLLPLHDAQSAPPMAEISAQLQAIRGIGPWTIHYSLLRGFGFLDGSLHGDVAVRRGLQQLLQHPDKLSEVFTRQWLEPFSPWRALVAAHLWAGSAAAG